MAGPKGAAPRRQDARNVDDGPTPSPYEHALALLTATFGDAGAPPAVVRIDIARDGALVIESTHHDKRYWFRYAARQVVTLRPQDDEAVPLAARIAEDSADSTCTVLAWRPGRRLALRVRSTDGEHIHKGFRRKKAELSMRRHETAMAITERLDIVVPALVAASADDASLVMAAHPGQVPAVTPEQADLFEFIGEQIRLIQGADAGGLETFGHDHELAVVDRWASRFMSVAGALPRSWVETRHHLGQLADRLPPAVMGASHRDLHDGQFMVSGAQVTLLDFDMLCRADVALDPANLLAHLTLRALQADGGATDEGALRCGRAFLDGLGRYEESGFWTRLRFYQASAFLRLSIVYSLRPRWSHLTQQLVVLASRCLVDVDKLRVRS